jgi:hypothetical protein
MDQYFGIPAMSRARTARGLTTARLTDDSGLAHAGDIIGDGPL